MAWSDSARQQSAAARRAKRGSSASGKMSGLVAGSGFSGATKTKLGQALRVIGKKKRSY